MGKQDKAVGGLEIHQGNIVSHQLQQDAIHKPSAMIGGLSYTRKVESRFSCCPLS
jgi:hypothetical protein